MDGLYRVTTMNACFGFVVEGGRVVRCAPYGRRRLLGASAVEALREIRERWSRANIERIAAPAPGDRGEGDTCRRCGGPDVVWFAPNDLWNRVNGSPNGILCPTCFVRTAEERGVVPTVWCLSPEDSRASDRARPEEGKSNG